MSLVPLREISCYCESFKTKIIVHYWDFYAKLVQHKYMVRKVMNACGSNGLSWQLKKLINFCFKLALAAWEAQSIFKILIGPLRNVKK